MAGRPGRVINISSDLSFTGRESFSIYCASKGAINALTKSWAREFSPEVLVNAIAPGPFATPMMAPMIKQMGDSIRLAVPLKRFGEPEDIAGLAIFLASRGAAYITGTVIPIDGGIIGAS